VIAGVLDSPWKENILSAFSWLPSFRPQRASFQLAGGGEVNGDNHTTNDVPSERRATLALVPITLTLTCA